MEVLTKDDQSWLRPYIKTSIATGQPVTALLLHEPNRARTKWDDLIITASHLLEQYEVDGWPVWIEESPRVVFEGKFRVSKSIAAIEKKQWEMRENKGKNDKRPKFGRQFYSVPKTLDGGPLPTRAEWLEMREKKTNVKKLSDGREVKIAADPDLMEEYRNRAKKRSTVE